MSTGGACMASLLKFKAMIVRSIFSFRERLAVRQRKTRSLLCVGLDPKISKMPKHLKTVLSEPDDGLQIALDVVFWMKCIVDSTAPFASMFKPQIAHFEALGKYGHHALKLVIQYIKENHPDIPIFLDCKRGDIGPTQQMYRTAQFDFCGAEGVNFNPYMGIDCMEALVDKDHPERALVGLAYTSNKRARQTQDVLLQNGRPYWEFIAECTLGWAEELGVVENAGLVMAAAYENNSGEIYNKHLIRCREIVGSKLWYLIPGVGTQGGAVEQTVTASFVGWGSIGINSSSEIIFASEGEDFAYAAGKKAEESYALMDTALKTLPAERFV